MGQRLSTAASVIYNGVPAESAGMSTVVVELAKDQGVPKVKTGDKFPMEPIVQASWKRAYTMAQLTKGVSKFLVITLPGAFTPT